MKPIGQQLIFDQDHYVRLIEARGETIRGLVSELKTALGLRTALDVGCGVGFFAKILEECGLDVRGFDGRDENINGARLRYPAIPFECGDVEDSSILRFGTSDLVLCFGLLYHLESPLRAIRNLRALTGKVLLLESMCLPGDDPFLLLREEPSSVDQSLTDVAMYASEGCIVKMCYRAGFDNVLRVRRMPDHEEFRDTREYRRRRTLLLAARGAFNLPGFELVPEPPDCGNPWEKVPRNSRKLKHRLQRFARRPASEKYLALARRFSRIFPHVPIPVRLPFGAWFLVGPSHVDQALFCSGFEPAEILFVCRYLKPGMTTLDIGAHHGLYTLLASKQVGPRGKVIAFEPSPREHKQLSRNVSLNFCKNVRIEPFALGSKRSRADLYVVEGIADGCNSLRPPVVDSETRAVSVDVFPFDDVARNLGLDEVDFVKLDVEGGELEVLQGAKRLLDHRPRPVLLVEVQDVRTEPWGYKAKMIISHLESKDYKWFRFLDGGKVVLLDTSAQSFDGNFIACPAEREEQLKISQQATSAPSGGSK